jgi:hypothetical protein
MGHRTGMYSVTKASKSVPRIWDSWRNEETMGSMRMEYMESLLSEKVWKQKMRIAPGSSLKIRKT